MNTILILILYVLVIAFLTLLPFRKSTRKYPKRYSCRVVDGKDEDIKLF